MTRGRGKYRVEHVDERPRGWRVRTKLSGSHVLRVGFPPGPRRRGSGRLLEVLHPRTENNPTCPVTARAKANPESLIVFGLGNPSRKRVSQITDRAKRYRGNVNIPPGEKRCAACGRKPNRIDVMHVDGHENNNAPENLMYGCRSCNVKMANTLRRAGMGTKTRQFNPSGGAQTLAQWVTAVMSMKGESDQIPLGEAIDIIRATPASRRSSFAKQIWQRRRRKNPFDWREQRAAGPSAIKHGDRVTFVDRFGKQRTGKAVMRSTFGGWVLNMGGAHGTPQVVSEDMVVKVRRGNPGDAEALKKLEAARKRYEQAKTQAAKRAAAEDIEFWGNKAAFLGGATNPRGRTVPEILRECDKIRAALRSRMGNPRRRRRHNQVSETEQAVKLFEIFHGKDPVKIIDKHVSAAMRKDYTALGKLVAVGLDDSGYGEREIAAKWDKCNHISFAEDGVTLASSPDGRQLYAIGGNQNLNGCLEKFQGVDAAKDFIDLGEVVFVVYEARKVHDNFEPVEYVHKFGGHGNTRPGWFYDRLKKQIFFIGGEYFIDVDAKISPGIEG